MQFLISLIVGLVVGLVVSIVRNRRVSHVNLRFTMPTYEFTSTKETYVAPEEDFGYDHDDYEAGYKAGTMDAARARFLEGPPSQEQVEQLQSLGMPNAYMPCNREVASLLIHILKSGK